MYMDPTKLVCLGVEGKTERGEGGMGLDWKKRENSYLEGSKVASNQPSCEHDIVNPQRRTQAPACCCHYSVLQTQNNSSGAAR